MRGAWLACLFLGGCLASEASNPAQRCNDDSACELDQVCYRGFCVQDERELDPVTAAEDAATPALTETDAAADAAASNPAPVDAGLWTVPEMAVPDASVAEAAVSEAVVPEAAVPNVPDASPADAGSAPSDASVPCRQACKPPNQGNSACKKCVKNELGVDVDALCGKVGSGDEEEDDEDKALNTVLDPVCIALCLGAASKDPSCLAQLLCHGPKCGGTR